MLIVSDTSPLSSLFLIEKLDLLPALFGRIIIPRKVMDELSVLENIFQHDLSVLRQAPWLDVQKPKDDELVRKYSRLLDEGESEAIVLAKELHADYLLIDEKMGRIAAKQEGLRTIGVLGVFLLAKKHGHISQVKPLIDLLEIKARFFIKESLKLKVLELAGEQP